MRILGWALWQFFTLLFALFVWASLFGEYGPHNGAIVSGIALIAAVTSPGPSYLYVDDSRRPPAAHRVSPGRRRRPEGRSTWTHRARQYDLAASEADHDRSQNAAIEE